MVVRYWETNKNRSPVFDFIIEQPVEAQLKIQGVLDYFENRGLKLLGTSDFLIKLRGYDLYELRIRASRSFYRIFVVIRNSVAWLVHAFKKQSTTTPLNDIKIALSRGNLIS